jgi:hypothetical protein
MRLLQPPQVSGEIMNLLDKARCYVVIVSPYNKITNWLKLAPYLRRLLERGLPVEYYVRKEHKHPTGVQEVREAGFIPIEIEDLHCKFYLNETYGIVTSMNLLISSDINSLEIGYVTETVQEYEDLVRFLDENIRNRVPSPMPAVGDGAAVFSSKAAGEAAAAPKLEEVVVPLPSIEEVADASVIACLSRILQLPLLANRPQELHSELSEVMSLHIEVRHFYVLAAYTFKREVRQKLYKALYAQRQEMEAQVGYPIQWGKDLLRVKLHLEILVFPPVTAWDQAKHLPVTEWSQAERERIGEQVQRASDVLQRLVPEVLLAVSH